MNKFLLNCLFINILLCVTISIYAEEKKKDIKTGWSIIPFPILYFNSDIGIQYGASCDLLYYGNGDSYPNYKHKFNAEVSRSTRGGATYRFFYDSKYLIPDTRLTTDICYLAEDMLDFYGFNGYYSPYFKDKDKSFYRISREMFRFTTDFQHKIKGNWAWVAGFAYYNYKQKKYQEENTLYQLYISEGIIRPDEAKGGNILQFKTGLAYDSRNIEGDPWKGIWSEAVLSGSPDWIDRNNYHHLRLTIVHRQYVPIWREKLTFAYRLGYQGTIAGHAPWYIQSNINTLYLRQTYSEGLGGITSLRGIMRNRIIGDGVTWLNAELRYRFLNFRLFKQSWYFVLNPLFDAGMVVASHRAKQQKSTFSPEIYSNEKERPHLSAGIGAKAVMNQNFVLSMEWGKAFDPRDGNNSLNFCMSFLF